MRCFQPLILIFLMFCLSGCPRTPHLPDESEYSPLNQAQTQQLFLGMSRQMQQVESLRARMEATIKKGPLEQKSLVVAVFQRPSLLRLEFFATALNRLAAIIIAKNNQLQAVDLMNREVYQGTASPDNFLRLLSVPFTPEQFMLWLSGRYPLLAPESQSWTARASKDQQTALIHIENQGHETTLLLVSLSGCFNDIEKNSAHSCGRLIAIEVHSSAGESLLYSSFSYAKLNESITSTSSPVLPSALNFWLGSGSTHGTIEFKEAESNVSFNTDIDRLFTLRTPANSRVLNLDQQERGSLIPFF